MDDKKNCTNKRYSMCKDQPAQIDCRVESCLFSCGGGQCSNISPAITLNPNGVAFCWSKTTRTNANRDIEDTILNIITDAKLSPTERIILAYFKINPHIQVPMCEIAIWAQVTSTTVCSVVRRLEVKGYIAIEKSVNAGIPHKYTLL